MYQVSKILFIHLLQYSLMHSTGNVYIGDMWNNRIRKITVDGTYGPTPIPTAPSPAPRYAHFRRLISNYPNFNVFDVYSSYLL